MTDDSVAVDNACPRCDYQTDMATRFSGERDGEGPEPGDLSVCLNCGVLSRFGEGLRLVEATAADWEALGPMSKQAVRVSQRHIRERGLLEGVQEEGALMGIIGDMAAALYARGHGGEQPADDADLAKAAAKVVADHIRQRAQARWARYKEDKYTNAVDASIHDDLMALARELEAP